MLAVVVPLLATAVVAVKQTAVLDQFLRRNRLAVLLKIGRAGAGDLVPVKHLLGHQPFMAGNLRAYRQIKPFPHHIAIAVVELQLDLHLRVFAGKLQQQRIKEGLAQGYGHGHAYRACNIIL